MSLLLAVAFLLGNAFFVGAQFALITARRDQIEPLAKSGNRAARTTLAQIRDLSRMLAGSQLGIAACSLGLGAVAEPAIAHLLENGLDAVRLPADLLHPIAFLLALALVSFCHMVLGEMVPKNLALAGPVDAALILGPPMAAWVWVTRPILLVINGLANALLKLIKVEPADELGGGYTADELTDVIAESAVGGLLDTTDQQRLTRALALSQRTVRDITIAWRQVATATDTTTARELELLAATTGYSRFPVRAGKQVLGYLHAKDVLDIAAADSTRPCHRDRADPWSTSMQRCR
ncbi:MAG TPA: CNNM domain-containing protein [Ilumatobacteraceae bacterium]|nr:CNNM domain-containing protein [Ilumatobacteraceae bacterium]